ncbi:hypothetical protein HN643_04535 [Candidatus Falkowbacteria bacterium]|jgi:hypothetical protein|nr:hypothetical protein [Candidatus Falkowbacteria bacterium]MBT5503292.1 hypothetical protein [Candidatus Falkowbacteria bacterium]MBT6574499.1 hypothetical protein [Candidatus Falkowbacteria bacterium]MBT7500907.1 hypothetical protein [Candidatus Falkowbacteria bacterium]
MDLDKLKQLNFPADQFAIFGSGPMAVRNIRPAGDIDLIVKPELWQELIKEFTPDKDKPYRIEIGNIEIYKQWKPWFNDIIELIDTADEFQGLRFVKLKHVLAWKKAMGRDKDLHDVKLINNFLKSSN